MIKKKVALVTGASSGIGLSTTKLLCENGYQVIACDKSSFGSYWLKQVSYQYEGVDILINNAGVFNFAYLEDTTPEIFEYQLELNLKVPFVLTKHFLPFMKLNQYGRIINLASQKGLKGGPGHTAYSSTKHGIIGLTKSIALEIAPFGITCNAICPGWVATPPLIQELEQRARKSRLTVEQETKLFFAERKQPNQNILSPDDISKSILFLISDSASQINGISLSHDNGNTID